MEETAATLDGPRPDNVVIRASAGTGKTHQLSNRYLRLLYLDEPVERILATTFTRKAAGEIFDRIVLRLLDAIEDPEKLKELGTAIDATALDRETCQRLLLKLTRQLHRTRVVTLDAFFAELAHMFALDIPLPPDWDIAYEFDAARVQSRAIERLLQSEGTEASIQLVHLLAKGATDRRVSQLITNTVTELFEVYRDSKPTGEHAWNWIPFGTNPDDADVAAALDSLRRVLDQGQITHKRLLGRIREVLNATDQDDWEKVAADKLSARISNNLPFDRKPVPEVVAEPMRCLTTRATFMVRVRMKHQLEACYSLLTKYERHYRDVCEELGLAFFSDIPDALRDLDDDREVLAHRLDSRIDHLLLDEFQDTSSGQWALLEGLANRVVQHEDASLFCVGDIKQAIYAWRNGTSDILNSLDKRYDDISSSSMEISRRSRPAIIQLVNGTFKGISQHDSWSQYASTIQEWSRDFPIHTAHHRDVEGYACLRSSELGTNKSEAALRRTAEVVKELWDQTPHYGIGVLVRRNSSVGDVMQMLRAIGVNASEEGGNPLTNTTAVRIILSLMRMADHPGHSAAVFHVAHSPLAGVVNLSTRNWSDPIAAMDAAQIVRRDLLTLGYGAAISKYANAIAQRCNAMQQRRLQQLVDLAYIFQRRAGTRATEFVQFVELRRVNDPTAANIHVMTVHQAKGLEFDRVVVSDLETPLRKNQFVYARDPQTFSPCRVSPMISQELLSAMPAAVQQVAERDQARRFREELCVLYVAMTRAKFEMHVVVAPKKPTKSTSGWPRSSAGLVRAALCDSVNLAPDTIAFECGNPNWYRKLALETEAKSVVADRLAADNSNANQPAALADVYPTLKFAKHPSDTSTRTDPAIRVDPVAPSQLEGGSFVSAASLFSQHRIRAMEIGTLMHGWLELIDWLNEKSDFPDDEQLRQVAMKQTAHVDAQLLERFHEILLKPHVQELFNPSQYRASATQWLGRPVDGFRFEALNEHPITFSDGKKLLSGSIDRLVIAWDGDQAIAADIIDYKTDKAENEQQANALGKHYAPQLNAYREAIASMLRLENSAIRTRLALTESNWTVEVEL